MQLQPHALRPDPELWRALHDAPNALAPRTDTGLLHTPLHGMPADRLAMAASRQLPPPLTAPRLS